MSHRHTRSRPTSAAPASPFTSLHLRRGRGRSFTKSATSVKTHARTHAAPLPPPHTSARASHSRSEIDAHMPAPTCNISAGKAWRNLATTPRVWSGEFSHRRNKNERSKLSRREVEVQTSILLTSPVSGHLMLIAAACEVFSFSFLFFVSKGTRRLFFFFYMTLF